MNEILSVLAGGGTLAAVLAVLLRYALAFQSSNSQQMREWREIIDQKDRQIADLQRTLADRDGRIQRLEGRVAELEREVRHRD